MEITAAVVVPMLRVKSFNPQYTYDLKNTDVIPLTTHYFIYILV